MRCWRLWRLYRLAGSANQCAPAWWRLDRLRDARSRRWKGWPGGRHCTAGCNNHFSLHGAAQCGACTPGCWWRRLRCSKKIPSPSETEVVDAIGGVLCRCTGYRKIISAILEAGSETPLPSLPAAGAAVGSRLVRLDGKKKVEGTEIFGADETPTGSLGVRVVRCPHHRARFQLGDLDQFVLRAPWSGCTVLRAKDVPGSRLLRRDSEICGSACVCAREARFRGEAVAASWASQMRWRR